MKIQAHAVNHKVLLEDCLTFFYIFLKIKYEKQVYSNTIYSIIMPSRSYDNVKVIIRFCLEFCPVMRSFVNRAPNF